MSLARGKQHSDLSEKGDDQTARGLRYASALPQGFDRLPKSGGGILPKLLAKEFRVVEDNREPELWWARVQEESFIEGMPFHYTSEAINYLNHAWRWT